MHNLYRIVFIIVISLVGFAPVQRARAQDGPIGVELPEDESPTEDEETPDTPPPEGEPEEPDGDPPPADEEPPPDEDAPPADTAPLGVVLPPEETTPPVDTPTPRTTPTDTPPAAAPPPPAETPSPTTATAEPTPPPEAKAPPPELIKSPPEEPVPEEKDEVFSWYTVSPQIGYLFFPKSEMAFGGLKATVDPRNGITVKLHFDLGGDDLAFEIAPLYAMEFGGIQTNADGFGNLSGLDFSKGVYGANFQAVGGETTIVYRFDVNRFFPHIGLGFRGTYLFGDQIEYGTEIYGRFPIGFTAYMAKHVAFVMEVGLMFGATGVRTPPKLPKAFDSMPPGLKDGLEQAKTQSDFENWYIQNQAEIDQWMVDNQDALPENYSRNQMATDFVDEQMSKTIRFGSGFGMDITLGFRFP